MDSIFYLAFRYVMHHRLKSMIVIVCMALSIVLPILGNSVLTRVEDSLRTRAEKTPLVVGAKGSEFDLTLHSLYFDVRPADYLTYGADRVVRECQGIHPIPIYQRHFTREETPILGTSLSYFRFRKLKIASGRLFGRIGHCVVGARVASRLELKTGSRLLSKPQSDIDIAGATPLELEVVGILEATGTVDDDVVFTDLKTTWIIDGLGHGHTDLEKEHDPNLFLDRKDGRATANAAVGTYIQITDENAPTFHFHGNGDDFPVSAILIQPEDQKSGTILKGTIINEHPDLQIVEPPLVIADLVKKILKIKSLFDLASIAIIVITCLFLTLNIVLSVRLRRREMITLVKIGCNRFSVFGLYICEYFLLCLAGVLLALGLNFLASEWLGQMVLQMVR